MMKANVDNKCEDNDNELNMIMLFEVIESENE